MRFDATASLSQCLVVVAPDWADCLFAALVTILLGTVFHTVSNGTGVMGADVANYLTTMRQVFGRDPTGEWMARPPLIAVPLKIATTLLPLLTATKLLAVIAWLASSIPVYALVRYANGEGALSRLGAVAAAAAYLLSGVFATMIAWGFITFLGILLTGVVAALLTRGVPGGSWRAAASVGAVVALLAATHQVSLAFALWWLASFGIVVLLLRRWRAFAFLAKCGVCSAAFSAPLIPLYLHLSRNTGQSSGSLALRQVTEFGPHIAYFHSTPSFGLWAAVYILALIGIWRLSRGVHPEAALVLGTMLGAWVPLTFASGVWGGRALYFALLPLWVLATSGGLGVIEGALRRSAAPVWTWLVRLMVATGTVFLLNVMSLDFLDRLRGSVQHFNLIDAKHLRGLAELGRVMPSRATVVTTPFFAGWWIEGALGRRAFETTVFDTNTTQYAQGCIARAVLAGNHVLSNGLVTAGFSFPDSSAGNPQVWITIPAGLMAGEPVPHSYLDDGATVLRLGSTKGSAREIRLQWLSQRIRADTGADSVSMEEHFDGDGVEVRKTTRVRERAYGWTAEYEIETRERLLSVAIPIYFMGVKAFESFSPRDFAVSQHVPNRVLPHTLRTHVQIDGDGAALSTRLDNPSSSSVGQQGVAWAHVRPRGRRFSVRLAVTIEAVDGGDREPLAHLEEPRAPRLDYLRARDLVFANDIGFLYAAEVPRIVTDRFNRSPAFEPLWREDDIYAYRVRASALDTSTSVIRALPSKEARHLRLFEDTLKPERWAGLHSEAIRLAPWGLEPTAITADVSVAPGDWGGVTYVAPEELDASDLHVFSAQLRWSALDQLSAFAVVFEDGGGRRWETYIPSSVANHDRDGWQSLRILRHDAARQDQMFDWRRLRKIHFTTFSKSSRIVTSRLEIRGLSGLMGTLQ